MGGDGRSGEMASSAGSMFKVSQEEGGECFYSCGWNPIVSLSQSGNFGMFASESRGESIANYSSHPIPNVVQLVGAANFSDMITPLGYAQNCGGINRACSGLMPPHEYCHIAEEEEEEEEEGRPKGKRKRLSDPSSPSHPSKTGEGDADTDLSGETSEADEKKQRITGRNQLRGKQVKEGCQGGGENNYIHVRARSGQATNSHSLAERVRREKISQRMRLLQELVPGCNKITGKAVMLDEIINYVQSLQQQVEFLSMKLATLNPELNFDIDQILSKDILHFRAGSAAVLGFNPGTNSSPHPYPPGDGHGDGNGIHPQGTSSAYHSLPQGMWDGEMQGLFHMVFDSNQPATNLGLNGSSTPEAL